MNIGTARRELLAEPVVNPVPVRDLPEDIAPEPMTPDAWGRVPRGPEDPGAASPARV